MTFRDTTSCEHPDAPVFKGEAMHSWFPYIPGTRPRCYLCGYPEVVIVSRAAVADALRKIAKRKGKSYGP